MIKKVRLAYSFGSLEDRAPFICGAGDPLEMSFKSAYTITQAVLTFENSGNGAQKMLRVDGLSRVLVPDELLVAGELKIKVDLLVGGEVVKTFTVEPILLKEVDRGIRSIPQIEDLQEKLDSFEQVLKKVVDGYNTMIDCYRALENRLKACEDRYDPANIL